MGKETEISWCDHTFNSHIGCTKVSAACDNCYAERLANRFGWAKWGLGQPRERTSRSYWRQPIQWNRAAEEAGVRRRVFCASLADVFDAEVPDAWRDDLFALVCKTPHLDWLLLTKRPQIAKKYFEPYRVKGPPSNVWLGVTVEDQKMADLRIPILLSIPARVRFLSCEPLLGPIRLDRLIRYGMDQTAYVDDALTGFRATKNGGEHGERIHWVIAGGESGPDARPSHPEWFRSLRDQCAAADVPFHFKQWGEWLAGEIYRKGDAGGFARHQDGTDGAHGGKRDVWWSGEAFGGVISTRVGKKAAGNKLDGRTHLEFPA